MYESEIRRFARIFVVIAKSVVENPDEPAAPAGGGGFAEWVMIAVNGLRLELGTSYRETYDLLSEMPGVLAELGLVRPPSYATIYNWFKRIPTPRWRAVRRASATFSGHTAIDSTGFDRDRPSRYRTMQVTFLVDVGSFSVLDVHCSTSHKGEAPIGQQVARRNAGDLRSLAADRGFDSKPLRDQLRGDRIRPLIPHREVSSLKKAHNVRIDRKSYNRRWMVETAISSIKRTLGAAGRARCWSLELREMLLKATVYNIRTAIRRRNPAL